MENLFHPDSDPHLCAHLYSFSRTSAASSGAPSGPHRVRLRVHRGYVSGSLQGYAFGCSSGTSVGMYMGASRVVSAGASRVLVSTPLGTHRVRPGWFQSASLACGRSPLRADRVGPNRLEGEQMHYAPEILGDTNTPDFSGSFVYVRKHLFANVNS